MSFITLFVRFLLGPSPLIDTVSEVSKWSDVDRPLARSPARSLARSLAIGARSLSPLAHYRRSLSPLARYRRLLARYRSLIRLSTPEEKILEKLTNEEI